MSLTTFERKAHAVYIAAEEFQLDRKLYDIADVVNQSLNAMGNEAAEYRIKVPRCDPIEALAARMSAALAKHNGYDIHVIYHTITETQEAKS